MVRCRGEENWCFDVLICFFDFMAFVKKIARKLKSFIRKFTPTSREINQRHCYDFPSENNGWVKFGTSQVYGDKSTGTIFDPYVYLENDKFYMCASERSTGSLILVESHNGKDWNKVGTMLSPIQGTWESVVNRGCVLKIDGRFHLWYTGQQNDISVIGHAVSDDGLKYDRDIMKPILGADKDYEGVSVMNPCVIYNASQKKYQMWYSAGENYEPDVLCYAESNDGIVWKKLDNPVLTKCTSHEWEKAKVGGCNVIIDEDGIYHMYYIGYQNIDVARICEAISKDGIHWIRDDNNLLIAPSKNSWDADATYKPSVVYKNKMFYLWYNGRKAVDEYIGLATKKV